MATVVCAHGDRARPPHLATQVRGCLRLRAAGGWLPSAEDAMAAEALGLLLAITTPVIAMGPLTPHPRSVQAS